MPQHRSLAIKREVLHELTPADLAGVVGGTATTVMSDLSCLPYVSCVEVQCWANDLTLECAG